MLRGRTIAAALAVATLSVGIIACGDDSTEPSIPRDDAVTLVSTLEEIQANIDEGSCFVAADRTDQLIEEINDLPSDVNQDVQNALATGATNLKELLGDPDQCEQPIETETEETTTEETTTERTRPETTETEQTQTQEQPQTQTQEQPQTQPAPGGGSGGVGPGGIEGGP